MLDKKKKHIETNILDNDFALSDIMSDTEVAAIMEEELLILSAMKPNKKSKKKKGKKVIITDKKGDACVADTRSCDTDYKVIGGSTVIVLLVTKIRGGNPKLPSVLNAN